VYIFPLSFLQSFQLHFVPSFHSSSCTQWYMKMAAPLKKMSSLQKGEKTLTVLRRCLSSHSASFTQDSYSPPGSSATTQLPLPSQPSLVSKQSKSMAKASPLSILPLSSIIRSLLVTSVSSSKVRSVTFYARSLLTPHRCSSDPL